MGSIKAFFVSERAYIPVQDEEDLHASKDTEGLITQNSRTKRRGKSTSFYVTTCVLMLAALTAFSLLSPIRIEISWAEDSPLPQFPKEIITLMPDKAFSVPSSPESDELWNSKLPGSKGFVMLEKAEKYNLPPGLSSPGNGTKTYGITWTHEYHCLALIRTEFWKLVRGNGSNTDSGLESRSPGHETAAEKLKHVQHCMDYIRQLIMCRADMTIEWAAPDGNGKSQHEHIDGYGIPHTCTKWNPMFEYMLKLQPPWAQKQAEKQLHDLRHDGDHPHE